MAATLTSKRITARDEAEAVELAFTRGWSDGLPVVPPTEARVRAMLEAAKLEPDRQVAFITHRAVYITAEKVAINAVMAGCRPEYMPVVVAAVEGIGDPRWSYHGPGTSTGGAGVLMVVNGPVARELDINAGDNLFGPGWRANATIGRAVRLVMRNVCGSRPGTLDRGTLGNPGIEPHTLRMTRRTARPMVRLARQPGPKRLSPALMSSSRAIGPLTIISTAAPPVEVPGP